MFVPTQKKRLRREIVAYAVESLPVCRDALHKINFKSAFPAYSLDLFRRRAGSRTVGFCTALAKNSLLISAPQSRMIMQK